MVKATMRTILSTVLAVCIQIFCICASDNTALADSGFVDDIAAINRTAKSVLMLEVYDSKDTCIATGSGFVAFNDSTLITNYHVIENGRYIIANTDDGTRIKIYSVLCSNKLMDIAILSFDQKTGIAPLTLYCGNEVFRGESVVAIGSPIGITNTVSKGNISALYTEDGVPWIQFTAPISHGSSGGVLLNDKGVVIGVTSAGYTQGENMNLAVRAIVAQAMYNAWDGQTHTFLSAPTASSVDFSSVEPRTELNRGIDSISDTAQWVCPTCKNTNSSFFCLQCGTARPEWTCICGQKNISPFCGRCGNSIESLVSIFDEACRAIEEGNYSGAISAFTSLGPFNSGTYNTLLGQNAVASLQIQEAYYAHGKKLLSEGKYTDAIKEFTKAGTEYRDSSKRIQESYYLYAESLLKAGSYTDAVTAFKNAGDYLDAAARINEAYYLYAESLLKSGKYVDASATFRQAGNYRDALSRIQEPYYVQGKGLLEAKKYSQAITAFNKCKEYSDAKELIKYAYYQIATQQFNNHEYDAAIENYSNAGDYLDASDKINEATYIMAVTCAESKDYNGALLILAKIPNYDPAKAKVPEYNYQAGILALNNQKYDEAISYFEKASSYEGANAKLREAYSAKMLFFVSGSKYEEAYSVYTAAQKHGILIEDIVIASVDEKGNAVSLLLKLAKESGFIKSLPKDENEYKKNYMEGVIKMETAFGLVPDGVIHLSEMVVLNAVLYPGYSGTRVSGILERLRDLGYITANLPADHTTYEKGYVAAVKKAEKALGLTSDGILTPQEQESILQQQATTPSEVKQLNAKASNGTVNLSWSPVKGALMYEIYRSGIKIATVTGTSYKDTSVEMDHQYLYSIAARNYSKVSSRTHATVFVDIVYKQVGLDELIRNHNSYKNKHIKLSGLQVQSKTLIGRDLQIFTKSGSSYVYIIIKDYSIKKWNENWAFLSKKNIVISVSGVVDDKSRGKVPIINAELITHPH